MTGASGCAGDGLAPEDWALGWHRAWIAEWFLEQAVRWIADLSADPVYITAVRRHLTDAAILLKA